MKFGGFIGLLAAMLALPVQSAAAHPHVWVDTVVGLVFDEDQITAIEVTWTFDGLFSGIILADFDSDQDNRLDDRELAIAEESMSIVLGESDFFTHVRVNEGGELRIPAVDKFEVLMRESDNRAMMRFVVPLAGPVDPEALSVAVYDISNYVSFAYEEVDPVRYLGDGNLGCVPELIEDPENSYYFGFVIPSKVKLTCAS